jgi:hypothetical protein
MKNVAWINKKQMDMAFAVENGYIPTDGELLELTHSNEVTPVDEHLYVMGQVLIAGYRYDNHSKRIETEEYGDIKPHVLVRMVLTNFREYYLQRMEKISNEV